LKISSNKLMVYKIAFIGTHGVGKTILALNVERKLRIKEVEATTIKEIAREASRIGFPINLHTTLEAQTYILHQQMAQELDHSTIRPGAPHAQVVISDRSVFDNYCYLERALKGKEQGNALNMVLGHGRDFPYDKLYLLPITNGEITNDGTRATEREFQEEMDRRVRTFLTEHRIPYTELPVPKEEDEHRKIWTEIIIRETLEGLRR
jgi:thymidylate kinase